MSTIFLVEDTMANRALAVMLLQAAGHQVIEAADRWDDAFTFADTVSRFAAEKRG